MARKHWLIAALVLPLLLTGCGVQTVYVLHGTPVRPRATVNDVKV